MFRLVSTVHTHSSTRCCITARTLLSSGFQHNYNAAVNYSHHRSRLHSPQVYSKPMRVAAKRAS